MTKYVPGASTNTVYQQPTAHFAFASSDADSGQFNGVCQSCHENPVQHHTVPFTDDHQITKANPSNPVTWTSTNCKECHQHVYTPSTAITNPPGEYDAFKPWHDGTQFVSNANCELCHGTGEIVKEIHNNNCDNCHTVGVAKSAATLKLGNSYTDPADVISPAGDARGYDTTASCVDCHQDVDATGFHGLSINKVKTRHQLSSDTSGGYDCETCHYTDAANAQLNRHMPADTVANCVAICHERSGGNADSKRSGINTKSVIDAVTFNDPYVNKNDSKCEDCHAAKGDFGLHGLTDDDIEDDGIDNASFDASADTVGTHNNLRSAIGEAPTYSGKLAGAYGGLKVTDYSCDDCHSSDRANATTLEAMQAHTAQNGTGSGNCLTCHSQAAFDAVIATATGASATTIECEDCHNATINGGGTTNSPSGQRMYQYDGIRHHKTEHAQSGNCTWCHADPRPDTPTTTNGFASTATAASSNNGVTNYDTGWETDFSGVTCPATVPKQLACRLCHTNYGTDGAGTAHSVNTYGGDGNHGYNQAGYSGTLTERTTGLTVYANDFNAGRSGASNNTTATVSATRISQTVTHRIDANDGSSMVNVYDYGACLGCHSVQIMHAAPVPGQDYPALAQDIQVAPWDTLRYAPGRAVFNELRGNSDNNQAWNDHRLRNENGLQSMMGGSSNYKTRGKSYFQASQGGTGWHFGGSVAHTTASAANFLNANFSDFDSQTGAEIIYFGDITAPTVNGTVNIVTVDSSVDEGVGSVPVIVRRSSGSDGAVSATVTLSGTATYGAGNDYTTTPAASASTVTLNWANGDTADKTITINVNDDSASESDQTIIMTITGTTGGLTIGMNDAVTTTIVDNDGTSANGTVNITTADSSCAEEACGAIIITANRTGGSSGAVTASVGVSGTAVPGVDYTLSSNAFFWADGESGNKTITLTVIDDAYVEPDETAIITITSTTGGLAIGPDPSVTITITNTDLNGPGTLEISTADASVPENIGTVNITCTRTGGDLGAVSATVSSAGSTAGGSDYSYAPATCSWADGDATDKTITLTINDDSVPAEPNETVVLTLTDGGALNGAVIGANNSVTTTIVDNDVPGTFDYTQANYSVVENGGSVTIYVSRSGGTFGAVSVNYSVTGGTAPPVDYTVVGGNSGTLNWADGDSANKSIVINVADNGATDGNRTVTFDISGPTGGASLGTQTTTTLTITDDENNSPVCGADTYSMSHGSALTNLTVMSNDNDGGDGGALSLTGVSATSNGGTAVLNGNSVDYTPSGAYVGDETFSYDLFDTFTTVACPVTVTLTNAAPVVTGETASIDVSATGDIEVLSNDTDADGDDLRILTATATCGTVNTAFPTAYVTPPAAQSINYTAPGTAGTCTINYTVEDEFGATAAGAVTVTVNPPDQITACAANWTPGSSTAPLNITENFNTRNDAAAAIFAQGWTTGTSYGGAKQGNNCWFTDTGSTASGQTGLTSGNPQPYVYLEATNNTTTTPRCGTYGGTDTFWLESPNIDAATYSTTLTMSFDWNYESSQTTGYSSIDVYYRNGAAGGWTLLQNITNTRRGNPAAWTSTGNINLNGVLSLANSRVRIMVTRGGTDYRHDVVFDNINVSGTAPASLATLDVLAANTAGLGGSPVTATYNTFGYPMANIPATNQWQLVAQPDASNTWNPGQTITITSAGDPTGMTCPVTNNAGAPAWNDVITVTSATWDGTDAVITATNTWGTNAEVYADYNGSGPTLMTNIGGNNWTITFSSVAYNATVDVTTSAAGTNQLNSPVTDLTATPPFSDFTETFTNPGNNVYYDTVGPFSGWTSGNGGQNPNGSTDKSAANDNWKVNNGNRTSSNRADTGPQTYPSGGYAYCETSNNQRITLPDNEKMYLQSQALDAAAYDFTLTFDYNCENCLTGTYLQVWVDDGGTGTFTQVGGTISTGATAGWVTNHSVDLSTAINSANSRIRIYWNIDMTGNGYQNDPAIDNITIDGTP